MTATVTRPTSAEVVSAASKIDGWMFPDELAWLFNTACTMRNVVEVGSWKGRSTYALASGCEGLVFAVDHWQGSPDSGSWTYVPEGHAGPGPEFVRNLAALPNVRRVFGSSPDVATRFGKLYGLYPASVDMVFIDGDHAYESVAADIEAWLPKAQKLICGHDYLMNGVARAVQEKFLGRIQQPVGTIWAVWL